MDEGRLAVVFRQEEQHRKFVYMMNDIAHAKLGLYTNHLAREEHVSSLKLMKNCAEVRRSVVRQRVLRKCLEMRKRKITTRDPARLFGQYGGKPLWAMSRDIDRVIADNHPRLRRMKRVEEAMRQGLDTGAILDQAGVSRRMEAFFQLKQAHRHQHQDHSPKRPPPEGLKPPALRRRNFFEPPSWAAGSSSENSAAQAGEAPSEAARPASSKLEENPDQLKVDRDSTKKGSRGTDKQLEDRRLTKEPPGREKRSDALGVINEVSLVEDSRGRLRGIRSKNVAEKSCEEDLEQRNSKNTLSGASGGEARSRTRSDVAADQSDSRTNRRSSESIGDGTTTQRGEEPNLVRSRSKLILPPIQPSKALVSKR